VMGLEADRMVNLDLSEPNVLTERDVVLEERRLRIESNPQALAQEQMEAALHLSHPYGRPVIGWISEISKMTRAQAIDFYQHHLGYSFEQLHSMEEALGRFKEDVKGYIIWDRNVRTSLNVAFTLAGLEKAVVITEEMLPMMQRAGLKEVADFRGKFTGMNDAAIYSWAYDRYWERCNKDYVVWMGGVSGEEMIPGIADFGITKGCFFTDLSTSPKDTVEYALAGKIFTVTSVQERLDQNPREREGLVLANGIFDLLHVGHVRYLEGAKQAGITLLVALNSDPSARKLKGLGRPLLPLEERLELVAALQCVDWVTFFEEDTVESLLRRIRPTVHAKGTDYTVETVPEKTIADRLGIRVAIVGDRKDHSTRELLQTVRKAPHD